MSILSINVKNNKKSKLYESDKFDEFNNVYCFMRIPHKNHRHLKIAYGHFFNNNNDFIGYREDYNLMHNNIFTSTYYIYPYSYIVHDTNGNPFVFNNYKDAKEQEENIINTLGYKYLYSRNGEYNYDELDINANTIATYIDGTEKIYKIIGVLTPKSIELKNLVSIKISETVTDIPKNIFSKIETLKSISVDKNNPIYDSRDNCNAIIETSTNKLIVGISTTVIPNSVTIIDEYAFNNCANLKYINIPDNINIYSYAFYRCFNLIMVNAIHISNINNYAFAGCINLKIINLPKNIKIPSQAFKDCKYINIICEANSEDNNTSTDNINNNSEYLDIEI